MTTTYYILPYIQYILIFKIVLSFKAIIISSFEWFNPSLLKKHTFTLYDEQILIYAFIYIAYI